MASRAAGSRGSGTVPSAVIAPTSRAADAAASGPPNAMFTQSWPGSPLPGVTANPPTG